MSNVIDFQDQQKYKIASQHYFGGCPECGNTDGYVNVRSNHWFVCDRHMTRWSAGANLFSGWREETEADWQRATEKLANYRVVRPIYGDYGSGAA